MAVCSCGQQLNPENMCAACQTNSSTDPQIGEKETFQESSRRWYVYPPPEEREPIHSIKFLPMSERTFPPPSYSLNNDRKRIKILIALGILELIALISDFIDFRFFTAAVAGVALQPYIPHIIVHLKSVKCSACARNMLDGNPDIEPRKYRRDAIESFNTMSLKDGWRTVTDKSYGSMPLIDRQGHYQGSVPFVRRTNRTAPTQSVEWRADYKCPDCGFTWKSTYFFTFDL